MMKDKYNKLKELCKEQTELDYVITPLLDEFCSLDKEQAHPIGLASKIIHRYQQSVQKATEIQNAMLGIITELTK